MDNLFYFLYTYVHCRFSKQTLHTACMGRTCGGRTGIIPYQPGQHLPGNRMLSPDHGAGYLTKCGGYGSQVAFCLPGIQFPDGQP